MEDLIKKLKKEVTLTEGVDLEYTGREEVGKLDTTITIPVKAIIMKSNYINKATGEEASKDIGSYEIRYDTDALKDAIAKELTPKIEKAAKDKIAYSGGDVLVGFLNSFWNPAYAKSVEGTPSQLLPKKSK